MIKEPILSKIKENIEQICKDLGFDVAILIEILHNNIQVVKIFGDAFSRPDLFEKKMIDRNLPIYQNEAILAEGYSDVSFVPTMGVGSDCGLRIRKTPYILTFDDVLGAPDLDEEGKKKIKSLQKLLEEKLSE